MYLIFFFFLLFSYCFSSYDECKIQADPLYLVRGISLTYPTCGSYHPSSKPCRSILNSIPSIYIAAAITSALSLSVLGGLLMYRTPRNERIFVGLLVILMFPMSPLAYHFVRTPFDAWFSVTTGKESEVYGFLKNFYAPLTEEPAKLWPLLIPFFLGGSIHRIWVE
jgi:hypothetical protein